jgi:hypothetical protein
MREAGIRYVVVHAKADPYQGAASRPDNGVRLLDRYVDDDLYELSPPR